MLLQVVVGGGEGGKRERKKEIKQMKRNLHIPNLLFITSPFFFFFYHLFLKKREEESIGIRHTSFSLQSKIYDDIVKFKKLKVSHHVIPSKERPNDHSRLADALTFASLCDVNVI